MLELGELAAELPIDQSLKGTAHTSVASTSYFKFHSNLFQPSNRHRYRN